MRVGHRPLIFRALMVLDEAIELARERPLAPSPGIRLALAYLFALSDGERRCFDDFIEHIGDEGQPNRPPGEAPYIRATYARGCFDCIIRGIGFNPTATVHHTVSLARRGGSVAAAERLLWEEVDAQAISKTRTPRPGCEWLVPRVRPKGDQLGVSRGVSSRGSGTRRG